MMRGEEVQSWEKVMCARSPLFVCVKSDARGRERRQGPLDSAGRRLLLISNSPTRNYLSQQIIKRADNEEINISIVERLYCLLGSLQRRLPQRHEYINFPLQEPVCVCAPAYIVHARMCTWWRWMRNMSVNKWRHFCDKTAKLQLRICPLVIKLVSFSMFLSSVSSLYETKIVWFVRFIFREKWLTWDTQNTF